MSSGSSALFYGVAVVELPALRPLSHYPPPPPPPPLPPGRRAKVQYGPYLPQQSRPTFVTMYPQGVELAPELKAAVLDFCFPDLDHLLRSPYSYEHVSDEYVFIAEQKVAPFRLHGFCRRYRIGGPDTAFRLDLSPSTAEGAGGAAPSPSFQCICILSEQCVWLGRCRGARAVPPAIGAAQPLTPPAPPPPTAPSLPPPPHPPQALPPPLFAGAAAAARGAPGWRHVRQPPHSDAAGL